MCIVNIALLEVGTPETGTNLTEYGAWYGNNGEDWCATFVSWCAYTANVDVSIIAKNDDCDGQMRFFQGQGRFHFGGALSGDYTPQAGDIAVFGVYTEAEKNATHVGIVEKVENGKVYTIEGNASNRVRYKNYALGDSYIIGYGNPDYESTGHIYGKYYCVGDGHILGCTNCGQLMPPYSTAPHLYYENYDETSHWEECAGCGHQKNVTAHSSSGYLKNSAHHWRECNDCGAGYETSSHIYLAMADGRKKCKICGYITGGISEGTIMSDFDCGSE